MGATMGKNGGNILESLPSAQGTLHVVMLGLDSAGKTTALYRLKFDQYLNTVPTIGFNCEKIRGTVGKAKGVQFLVWDVGGQEKLRPLWRSYTRCTDGIVFVVDSVDVERMEEAKMELMRTAKCPDNQGVPVLILANKQDLPGAREPKELEKLLSLHELSNQLHLGYSQSSFNQSISISPSTNTSCGASTGGSGGGHYHESSSDPSFLKNSSSYTTTQSITSSNTISGLNISATNIGSSGGGGNHSNTSSLSKTTNISQLNKSLSTEIVKINNDSTSTTITTTTIMDKEQQQQQTDIKELKNNDMKLNSNSSSSGSSNSSSYQNNYRGWYIQPACAITGEGLQEGLDALYDMIIKKRKLNKIHKKKR